MNDCSPEVDADDCELPPDLADALVSVMSDQPRGDGAGLQAGALRLVSDNSASPGLQLSRIIELEIIPRLMLMHGATSAAPEPAQGGPVLTVAHVETLTHLAVDGDAEHARHYVDELVAAGAPLDQIFLYVLAPAAQLMGRLWSEDVYDFSQVTIGMWRLQQVLHRHGHRLLPELPGTLPLRRLLLATEPGSQHTFGLAMLGEFFVRDGWDVACEPAAPWDVLFDRVSAEQFDVLGLSIGVDTAVSAVASAILRLRRASCNSKVFVMVGGPAAHTVPELARQCGADAMALDAPSALALARRRTRPLRQTQ